MNLGNSIRQLREERNIKQHELATKAGITQTYLSQIENNQKRPSQSALDRISEALDVPTPILYFLAMEENDISEEKRPAFHAISPLVKALVETPGVPQTNGNH